MPVRADARLRPCRAAGRARYRRHPLLDHSLRVAGESGKDVVLDLRELDFIDSSGAHLLINADRRVRRSGGRLRIITGSGEVAWLLQLVGVDRERDLIEPPHPEGSEWTLRGLPRLRLSALT
jgi:anti-sigma B factor antagonist